MSNITTSGNFSASGNATIGGTLSVAGTTTLGSVSTADITVNSLSTSGNITSNTLTVNGGTITLSSSGGTTINNSSASNPLTLASSQNIAINGGTVNFGQTGNINWVNTLQSTSGNLILTGGTLTLTNGSLFLTNGNITAVTGNINITGASAVFRISGVSASMLMDYGDITLTNGNIGLSGASSQIRLSGATASILIDTGNINANTGNIVATSGSIIGKTVTTNTALSSFTLPNQTGLSYTSYNSSLTPSYMGGGYYYNLASNSGTLTTNTINTIGSSGLSFPLGLYSITYQLTIQNSSSSSAVAITGYQASFSIFSGTILQDHCQKNYIAQSIPLGGTNYIVISGTTMYLATVTFTAAYITYFITYTGGTPVLLGSTGQLSSFWITRVA